MLRARNNNNNNNNNHKGEAVLAVLEGEREWARGEKGRVAVWVEDLRRRKKELEEGLQREMSVQTSEVHAAEIHCHNKISQLLHANDDLSPVAACQKNTDYWKEIVAKRKEDIAKCQKLKAIKEEKKAQVTHLGKDIDLIKSLVDQMKKHHGGLYLSVKELMKKGDTECADLSDGLGYVWLKELEEKQKHLKKELRKKLSPCPVLDRIKDEKRALVDAVDLVKNAIPECKTQL
eukprot:Nk52_evm1s398 gene=Nk52_evmTU1s398